MQTPLNGHIVLPSKSPSVIPIVAPSSSTEEQPVKTMPKIPSKGNDKRLCRNVIIHGYCKYEGKGCEFNHSTNATTSQVDNMKPKTPTTSTISNVNAPEFVPRFASEGNTPTFAEALTSTNVTSTQEPSTSQLNDSFSRLNISPHDQVDQQQPAIHDQLPEAGHDYIQQHPFMLPAADPYMFMNHTTNFLRQPLQHHFYSSSLSHTKVPLLPHQRLINSFFIPDKLREELTQRNEAQWMTSNDQSLPTEVHVYHSLYPLEQEKLGNYNGYPATVYKATCSIDRRSYALVRIEGYSNVNESAVSIAEVWRNVRHCNIVSFREGFTTKAFGDDSIVFVYDYHPCAKTLLQHYFRSPKQMFKPAVSTQSKGAPLLVSEKTLWSYIVQITSAIKTIHSSGLACRNIQLNRILITGEDRIRLTGVGILDVLQGEADQQLIEYQQQDFISLGTLIIQLACNLSTPSQNITQSLEYLSRMYSEDLKIFVSVLMDENTPKSIDDILIMIAPRILEKINRNHFHNDDLEQCLGQELENGRLVRLISKMGFINERPEFDMDPSWSETGDRYLIKLFRDYVFHQVDEHGQPVIDMVHVLTCLKKLDAGVDEKIMLMSRDEKSCLIT
ncbi:hypothetical protein G6F68_005409 [Rhizopus microsporus]|nr:hypothetical protein G6F69_003062 [Rhizopus microsporus]KAG1263100.1 hypothetical protein G6F68_005409 [Rhizopus microsporus]